jgi:RHS repeat-associated protein
LDDGSKLYRYNYRNQLSRVLDRVTNTELLRLHYDATGRLVTLRDPVSASHLVNDGLNVIEEYSGSNLTQQYVNENGTDQRCQLAVGGEEWWYHADLIHSTRLISNSHGQVPATARFKYDPFGAANRLFVSANPYLFASKRLLGATELYDSRARQYSPSLGRFLQRDPNGMAEGPNLYLYCSNNPISFMDPLGREKQALLNTLADIRTLNQKLHELWESGYLALMPKSERETFESTIGYPGKLKEAQEAYDALVPIIEKEVAKEPASFDKLIEMVQATGGDPFLPVDIAKYRLGPRPTDYIMESVRIGMGPVGFEAPVRGVNREAPRILGDILSRKSAAESAEIFRQLRPTPPMVQAELKALEVDAEALGYTRVKGKLSHGQPVFEKSVQRPGPDYISPDVGSGAGSGGAHAGGVWKGAKTIYDLGKKETRLGTYDRQLKKVGD